MKAVTIKVLTMDARVLCFIEILSTIFFHVQCVIELRNDCKAVTCGFKLTAEHSAQISTYQYLGSNEAKCVSLLRDINVDDLVAVYCPDEKFCGIDLNPEYTKKLNPFLMANCSVFAKSHSVCETLHDTLLISGSFFSKISPFGSFSERAYLLLTKLFFFKKKVSIFEQNVAQMIVISF